MRRASDIAKEEVSMNTLLELTSAFEGIASMRIAQIKDQVLHSTEFFNELWAIYKQIKIEDNFGFGRAKAEKIDEKELQIVITGEGGFSGDIDQKVVELVLSEHDPAKHDIIVIGHHGVIQLAQRGVSYKKYFKMPVSDTNINVEPLVRQVQQYKSTKVFYQQYISLSIQDVRRIELSTAIAQEGKGDKLDEDVINENTYIFEPSSFEVASHLERSMMKIAVGQLILESKLAQYASRFRAMTASRQKAGEMRDDLHMDYNRSRRATKDERLKEIINGINKGRSKANS